jgi:SAM-dependent methyltransferase
MLPALTAGLLLVGAPTAAARVTFISWAEARPVVEALAEGLPPEIAAKAPLERQLAWPGWVAGRDREIRSRLAQGALDSLAHLMLFGTSFTKEPRATIHDLGQVGAAEPEALKKRLEPRARDLARALASPGTSERLLFLRGLLRERGLDGATGDAAASLTKFLYENLARVLNENGSYARALEGARLLGDPSAEFAERSHLFKSRGLSSDTSLLPNFALEESLRALQEKGLLTSVRRVAIVGPGLDFADKQDGYDFYPQQTLQPFAVVDSLLRLGLARLPELRVSTYDLSPQVNDHLARAAASARRGRSYVVQIPRDASASWKPEAVRYWQAFGSAIGASTTPAPVPPGAGDVKTRAVRVRPEVVARIEADDVNIVLQRPSLAPGEEFDLVIATNILVYYDVFEQSLALANVAAILKPGGFLLSNNAVLELPGSLMRSVGYKTTVYSDREADGDHIVWYRRLIE